MKKYICIHGHFYQPPRENAWLEVIELQEGAYPYHDWNEKINVECYAPNSASRILNEEKRIINIVNNYANISFNFGPTLLSWLETSDADTYQKILEADIISRSKHNGHGNAIAQIYNHIIMPLANTRDKETQIIWGIADFKKRFNREPEGMWLSETAVDYETLELLAIHKIKFTILAPRQAKSFKLIDEKNWTDVSEENIDTTQPYVCNLPSGKQIVLFFYNARLSRDVAFNGLLTSGKIFADRLMNSFSDNSSPQLVHIATDGETYGHHHPHGDMALASCINYIEKENDIAIANYAEYLSVHHPLYEIKIHENTSWSCVHGVERWRSDCGCKDGGNLTYHQKWRAPLRNALNWLSKKAADIFELSMLKYNVDAWKIRNAYIEVILNRTDETVNNFLKKYFNPNYTQQEKENTIRLLEMQRHAMLMFTSCGWFFDEVSRIETKQILHYADRVIQTAENEAGISLYDDFLKLLEEAPSNIEKYKNAAVLYAKEIRPKRLTLTKVGMHYAASSLFEEYPETQEIFNYKVRSDFFERFESGNYRLSVGRIQMQSKITYSLKHFRFAALYFGQHNILGSYADDMDTDAFEEMYIKIRDAFKHMLVSDVISIMQKYFGEKKFSFRDLFKDERRNVLHAILQKDIALAEDSYKKIYDRNFNIINELYFEKMPVPEILLQNIEMVVNNEIKKFFGSQNSNPARMERLTDEVAKWNITLHQESISFAASQWLFEKVTLLQSAITDMQLLDTISRVLIKLNELKIKIKFSKAQNVYFHLGKNYIDKNKFIELAGDNYPKWLLKFKALGEQMNIRFE